MDGGSAAQRSPVMVTGLACTHNRRWRLKGRRQFQECRWHRMAVDEEVGQAISMSCARQVESGQVASRCAALCCAAEWRA